MFWQKFLKLCKETGKSPNRVAMDVGISSGTVTNWKNGGIPQNMAIYKLANYFSVPISYFSDEEDTPKAGSVKIPVYGVISAGLPSLAEQEIIDYEEIPAALARSGEYYALQVKGDSMEPRMFAGDVVILRKTQEFESGKICAVGINGDEATLKRVYVRPNGITLFALNSKYEPINFNAAQVENLPVVCMGVCVEVRGKLML